MALQWCADSLLCFVAPSWLLWIVAGLALNGLVHLKHLLPSILRGVMEYGKLRIGESKSGLGYLLTVPKSWFTHFYVWGVIWNYTLFSMYTLNCIFHSDISIPIIGPVIDYLTGGLFGQECSHLSQYHFNVFLVLLILCIQVTRRLYECLYVSIFSTSRMHIVHYVLGIYFYTAVGLTALLHQQADNSDFHHTVDKTSASLFVIFKQFLKWYHVLAVTLYFWASYHQHQCHQILADLRKPTKDSKTAGVNSSHGSIGPKYGMPRGDWFRYVSCPHLFAEILIYLSLLTCQVFSEPTSCWWLVVAHVTGSLYLSARQMHSWYRQKFDDYPKNRTSLFPGLC